ncbi:GHKL domain-containing protein [Tumebacillus sp. ITR2]|uniref:histidine kinase n=1 Tax=Tumebacillus amylolyticus TaxID=2801339 RepID=A0ABS1J4W4_9BACL|nr:sensor histidine kinase [Tumebacillus amylolyticus]MBL0385230.1 GHKL domain-containing protein [Tumebacillus amylolyticus]
MSKDFFLNVMIVLFPVLFYQVFHNSPRRKRTQRNKLLIGLFGGLSAVACLNYPFVDGYGIFWDFRVIPLTLAMVYGGRAAGGLALGMEIVFRLWIGGPQAWFSVLFSLVLYAILLGREKKFLRLLPRQRVAFVTMFSVAEYLAFLGMLAYELQLFHALSFREEGAKNALFLLLIGLLQAVVMAIAALVVEHLISTSRMRSEVQRTEKLGVISELAASVAHEVRNPLTVVRGFLQIARGSLDDRNRQYMNTALAELDRAEFIISDYLNFAKLQVETVSVFEASLDLHHTVKLMSSYALLRGVKLDHQIEPGLWVHANQEKLKQAVINLLKNSIEACHNGGQVKMQAYRDSQQVILQVLDTGVGMNEEQIKRLGHPFYTTKEKGTGLGLMVTFRILQAMDGQLAFESNVGVGTTATIRLPLTAP